jgi:hypothetical protein
MRLVKRQSLIAVALIALSVPAAESRFETQQAVSSMPGGPLASRTYTMSRRSPQGEGGSPSRNPVAEIVQCGEPLPEANG